MFGVGFLQLPDEIKADIGQHLPADYLKSLSRASHLRILSLAYPRYYALLMNIPDRASFDLVSLISHLDILMDCVRDSNFEPAILVSVGMGFDDVTRLYMTEDIDPKKWERALRTAIQSWLPKIAIMMLKDPRSAGVDHTELLINAMEREPSDPDYDTDKMNHERVELIRLILAYPDVIYPVRRILAIVHNSEALRMLLDRAPIDRRTGYIRRNHVTEISSGVVARDYYRTYLMLLDHPKVKPQMDLQSDLAEAVRHGSPKILKLLLTRLRPSPARIKSLVKSANTTGYAHEDDRNKVIAVLQSYQQ